MNRKNHTIEIIAIGSDAVYSIGKIQFTKQGDVYLVNKIRDTGMHLSRHKDGKRHVRMKGKELFSEVKKRASINDLDGIEYLGTWAFSLDTLPKLYTEYKLNNCNVVVTINMRHYEGLVFNLGITLLTKKGIPQLMNMWKDFENRQIYVCASSSPMVGIVFGAINIKS